MKALIALAAVLVAVWAGLWIANTGVLVYSGSGVLGVRDCRYFVGVSVVKRIQPGSCPITQKVSP